MLRDLLIVFALVLAMRLPFLTHPIQGDDIYYLEGAQYAQIDPAHPHHAKYVFQGRSVDMRGHPHPPLNAWILAAILAVTGDVKEVTYHAVYTVFSLLAALGMYLFARRFTSKPLIATALFCAVPAFVVNGNSLESDLPFLAFWTLGMALFFEAIETGAYRWLLASVPCLALAGLAAYQSVIAIPILWLITMRRRPNWWVAYGLALTPALVAGLYQLSESIGGGAVPLQVTAGYFKEYGLQQFARKLHNAEALTGHLGWMIFPALAIAAFPTKWMALALLAALVDWHPLYVAGVAAAIGILAQDTRRFGWWPQIFFGCSLLLFFAGSARYLLPMAPPIAVMIAAKLERRWLVAGLAANLTLGLALALSNYQHWQGYRDFIGAHRGEIAASRLWVNGEWGMRFYAESLGGLPLEQGQPVRLGDLVLTSELGYPIPFTAGGGQLVAVSNLDIYPTLPLRLIGLKARSGYSDATSGVRPFDIDGGPVDRIHLERVIERKPTLSYVPMGAAEAPQHLLSGTYQLEEGKYRWIGKQARLVLQPAKGINDVVAVVYIPPMAKARRVTLEWNGLRVAESVFMKEGLYTVEAKAIETGIASGVLTITCDATFQAPGDTRELGLILQEAGLR